MLFEMPLRVRVFDDRKNAGGNMFEDTLELKKRLSSEKYLVLKEGYQGEWSGSKSICFQLFFQAPQTISALVCDFIYLPPFFFTFVSSRARIIIKKILLRAYPRAWHGEHFHKHLLITKIRFTGAGNVK